MHFFKQMPVPIRSRGNTSTVLNFLCFYDIDVTLLYILEKCVKETSV